MGGPRLGPPSSQSGEEPEIHVARADRDAQMTGKADSGAVAHDEPGAEQPRSYGVGVGDAHEQEIRLRRWEPVPASGQLGGEERALLEHDAARAREVVLVLERGDGRDLAETIDVVGRARG